MFLYQYQTSRGPIQLVPTRDARYIILYQEENLGSYHSARAAADDASGGYTFSPSNGVDLGLLGIPADLEEWERLPFRFK